LYGVSNIVYSFIYADDQPSSFSASYASAANAAGSDAYALGACASDGGVRPQACATATRGMGYFEHFAITGTETVFYL
jgi:hypothetical protein